jgi:predicted metalloprotease with PDZ domain
MMRLAACAMLCACLDATAAPAAPAAASLPPPLPMPQDKPYPGIIDLQVDATDLGHHVFAVTETLPVSGPGPLTLLYPKFIPGTHSPAGPIAAFAGLTILAHGTPVAWKRDVVEPYAFLVDIPPGISALSLSFQFLSPVSAREGDVLMTQRMLVLQWNQEILYPAGHDAHDITVQPHLVLPPGWQFGTALGQTSRLGDTVAFSAVPLDVLLDSPVYAGRYFARFDLAPGAKTPVHLDVVADEPEDLTITPAELQAHRNLVAQAARNFGSQHYDHFDFLLSLSDELDWRGLEHHRSSENGEDRSYFTNPDTSLIWHDLLPHEYIHSWDGKFRRPADLWSPDYTVVPERGSLLWVYEGQTEYWGQVLAARAGLTTAEQFRDFLAYFAAELQARPGRTWRNLQDTTNDPVINERRPLSWTSYSRAEDYYMEGMLTWLEADALIRERTGNAKSLTDFARGFFGVKDGDFGELSYGFDDVVNALNAVTPYDWRGFLRDRLDSHPNDALLDGISRAGWRLSFTETESAMQKNADMLKKSHDFSASLGLELADDGTLTDVLWDGPAFRAGLSHGVKLVAVNGLMLDSAETLAHAVTLAKSGAAPMELLILDGKHYRTVRIDYHGGLRYPHLERITGTADRLSDILAPLP